MRPPAECADERVLGAERGASPSGEPGDADEPEAPAEPVESAYATPGTEATAAPMPRATASAPMRPTCLAYPAADCRVIGRSPSMGRTRESDDDLTGETPTARLPFPVARPCGTGAIRAHPHAGRELIRICLVFQTFLSPGRAPMIYLGKGVAPARRTTSDTRSPRRLGDGEPVPHEPRRLGSSRGRLVGVQGTARCRVPCHAATNVTPDVRQHRHFG